MSAVMFQEKPTGYISIHPNNILSFRRFETIIILELINFVLVVSSLCSAGFIEVVT